VAEQLLELRLRLLARDDNDLYGSKASDDAVERLGDLLQVVSNEHLDVALIAGLRPAALVVPARLILRVVGEILEPPAAEAIEVPELAADDQDQGALTPAHERDERSQVERLADLDPVRHCLGQRKWPPDVVQPGGEDGEPVGAVAGELALIELADAFEVGSQADALIVSQVPPVGAVPLRSLVEQRMQPRGGVGRSRTHVRVEVEV